MKRNNFVDLLRFELRKLIENKVTIIMFSVCILFLSGVTFAEYLLISPEDRYISKHEADLEGRPLDNALISEVALETVKAGGVNKLTGKYVHVANYINRVIGSYMNIDGISGKYSVEDLTEEDFYQVRRDIMAYLYDHYGLSSEEKLFWAEKSSEISEPFVWYASYGIWSLRGNYGILITILSMTLSLCLSGIFSSERRYKTDELILCTREGKNTLSGAKIFAGGIFSLAAALILLSAVGLPHIIFNGLDGINTICQLIAPFSDYPLTSGEMLLICTSIYILASLMVGAIVILLSCTLNNSIAAAGSICFITLADLFIAVPPKFRIVSQIRYLTPVAALMNSSMTDPRLIKIGGRYFTVFEIIPVLYMLVASLLCLYSILICRKRIDR